MFPLRQASAEAGSAMAIGTVEAARIRAQCMPIPAEGFISRI
jgi:hypothetical protein